MKPFALNRVLVPLDGSPLAECALRVAQGLLSPPDGELVLMRVPVYADAQVPAAMEYTLYWPEIRDLPAYYNTVREESAAYLDALAEQPRHGSVRVRPILVDGDRGQAIIDTAAEELIDLIVMTTHGRTGLARWVMGSVTEQVLHGATCPVLAVRPMPDCPPDKPVVASLGQMMIALDGSKASEAVLPAAIEVARRLALPVTLFHAWPRNGREGASAVSREYLLTIRDQYAATGLSITPVLFDWEGGSASQIANCILDYAETSGVGLIAMSTYGSGKAGGSRAMDGLRRWVYGSVTERVLHGSRGGMLITRPQPD